MTIANTLSSLVFLAFMLSGQFPITLRLRDAQWWDWGTGHELIRVGYPVTGRQLAGTFGRFPFLFIIATLGTHVVAAYAIGRRILRLVMTPVDGFRTASSTLVGQNLGADEAAIAEAYGWQVLRLALVTQVLIAALVVVFVGATVAVFSTDSPMLPTQFLYVFAVSISGSVLPGR